MKVKTYGIAPEREHPTIGYEQPTRNLRGSGRGKSGCLCLNRNYYSLKCCQGYLGQQGVGLIQSSSLPAQPTYIPPNG